MSIQQAIAGDYYKLADMARTPEQINSLKQHIAKSVTDGNLMAYEGIPLIQSLDAKTQEMKKADAIKAGLLPPQQPIGQQILQSALAPQAPQGIQQALPQQAAMPPQAAAAPQQMAQAMPQQGIDTAQSNLPEQYAGGGIIAFDDGGDVKAPEYISELPAYLQAKLGPLWEGIKQQVATGKVTPGATFNPALQAPAQTTSTAASAQAPTAPAQPEGPPTFPEPTIHRPQAGPTSAGPAAPPPSDTTDTSGIDSLLKKYGDMITAGGKDTMTDKEIAGWTALANLGFGIAGGSSLYPLVNVGQAGLGAVKGYTEAMRDIKQDENKRMAQLMALDLKGQELKTELKKLGITEQHYNDWRDIYRAKAANAGIAAQRVGPISPKDLFALKNKYQNIMVNPKADKVFYSSLPQRVQDLLTATPGTKSYNEGMDEVKRIAKQKFQEDYRDAKIAGAKSPDTITAMSSDIEP